VLTERLWPLAARLSQLSTTVQILSRVDGIGGRKPTVRLEPFEQARQHVRSLLHHLEEDRVDEAAAMLDALSGRFPELDEQVARADALIPTARLSRHLADNKRLRPELLARMLEYYAADPQRGEATREKMITVALSLLASESTAEADPDRIRKLLNRRRVNLPLDHPRLPAPLVASSRTLRRRIAALDSQESASLVPLYTLLKELKASFGQHVYCLAGLSELLATEWALKLKQGSIEAPQIQAFFGLADELDQEDELEVELELDEGAEPEPGVETHQQVQSVDLEELHEIADTIEVIEPQPEDEPISRDETATNTETVPNVETVPDMELVSSAEAAPQEEPERVAPNSDSAPQEELKQTATSQQPAQPLAPDEILPETEPELASDELARLISDSEQEQQAASCESAQQAVPELQTGDPEPAPESPPTQPAGPVPVPSEAASAESPERARSGRSARPGRRRRLLLTAAMLALAAISGYYHLSLMDKLPLSSPHTPVSFRDIFPLSSVTPTGPTLIAVAQPAWQRMTPEERQMRAQWLWSETRARGFQAMVLTAPTAERPLALGSGERLVFPEQAVPTRP
jgi:hypothetical protein